MPETPSGSQRWEDKRGKAERVVSPLGGAQARRWLHFSHRRRCRRLPDMHSSADVLRDTGERLLTLRS
jgi:hypothetical protein